MAVKIIMPNGTKWKVCPRCNEYNDPDEVVCRGGIYDCSYVFEPNKMVDFFKNLCQNTNLKLKRVLIFIDKYKNGFKDISINNAFLFATKFGNSRLISDLLQDEELYVNFNDSDVSNALLLAIDNENEEIVSLLLNHKADANTCGTGGNTALMLAIQKNNINIVKMLIDAGADCNKKNYTDKSALLLAIDNENEEIVSLLLNHKADANVCGHGGNTALMIATQKNNINIAKMLIDAGADCNKKNYTDKSALMMAIANNNTEIVKALVAKGVDVNKRCNGITPLMEAARCSVNKEIVEILIDVGANLSVKDNNGYTVFFYANINNNVRDDIVDLLKHYSASISNADENLLFAIETNSFEDVIDCLNNGANPNTRIPNIDGLKCKNHTVLMRACECDDKDFKIVRELIKWKADVNAKKESGWTAIMSAARYARNYKKLIEILSNAGADRKATTKKGTTAQKLLDLNRELITFIQKNAYGFAKIRLEKGANPNAKRESDGKSALQIAKENGNEEIIALLKRYGAKE